MNRFTTYLRAQNLAKLLLTQAEELARKGETDRAVRDTIKAMQAFMTSMNNIASLLREPRRKVRFAHERKKSKKQPVKIVVTASTDGV